jgi:hypothetical protein
VKTTSASREHAAGRIGLGGWIAIAALLVLLAGSLVGFYLGWTSHSGGIEMPGWGYAILGVGILFAMAVGSGLMALIFYSSRRGYDEPFSYDARPDERKDRRPDPR